MLDQQAHGHVEAVRAAMKRLGFDALIDAKSLRERDLVVAMVAGRILAPEASKLGMTQAWSDTTLADDLGLADAHEDELYAAMDWLLERQGGIEKRLAKRHLKAGGLVLFDLTSNWFEGTKCPLAKLGYSRDGKPGTQQLNYGLPTDDRGCPVSVAVFDGNTGDPKTLLPQVEKVRDVFGIDTLVMVGDPHMRQAWTPLLFADEATAEQKADRDPVAPARRSRGWARPAPQGRRGRGAKVRRSRPFGCHSSRALLGSADVGITVMARYWPLAKHEEQATTTASGFQDSVAVCLLNRYCILMCERRRIWKIYFASHLQNSGVERGCVGASAFNGGFLGPARIFRRFPAHLSLAAHPCASCTG